ncbi:MAG TPA: type II toxin-antitoxin system RelE/ParE family toxin [Chitinophagales bacterium]|nr:type II toxin-antitoxin system RelE/ParE family toxin [Chitinophagales bacterium]
MSYNLLITPKAQYAIEDAVDWYFVRSGYASAYFIERIEEALSVIAKSPLQFPVIYKSIRQLVLSPFPYVLLYTFDGTTVKVLKIFHTSQNPKKKFK